MELGVQFSCFESESEVMSDSLRPHGLQPTKLLRPWDFPGKNIGVGCHCLLRHGTTDWFQIGKGVRQGCILSPAYLTYTQSTS